VAGACARRTPARSAKFQAHATPSPAPADACSLCPCPCPAAGYTSGYLPALPTDCAGLTARACYACQKLPTPSAIAGCLACAKAAKVDQYKTVYNGPSVNSRAETCAACYAAGVANPAG
jgi:hypothetical protein